mmetsp:Transcript_2329/g.10307  ORF Transcript_2329/g.10307 Transcript_2329/m.10307 type:complete len:200 (+) Transcript_2329:309-908(+)
MTRPLIGRRAFARRAGGVRSSPRTRSDVAPRGIEPPTSPFLRSRLASSSSATTPLRSAGSTCFPPQSGSTSRAEIRTIRASTAAISSSVAALDEPFRPPIEPFRPTIEPFRPTIEPANRSATASDSPGASSPPDDSPPALIGEALPTVTAPSPAAPPTMSLLCDANDSVAMMPDKAYSPARRSSATSEAPRSSKNAHSD